MGLRDDLERFRVVGEDRREDLADFIRYGDLGASDEREIRIPIKIVELPEFRYDPLDQGGVGAGDAEVGDPVDARPGDSEEGADDGEPGSERGEHSYYRMDPEEFAQALDEELGLDLEPKGKQVIERTEGAFTDRSRAGPESMLDLKHLFVQGLKRKLVTDFDDEFLEELLKVAGVGPDEAFEWARHRHMRVSRQWLVETYATIPNDERDTWPSTEALEAELMPRSVVDRMRGGQIENIALRREDERYRHPEIVEEYERNVVVVNIRDVSGSMRAKKRELVERTFTPLDWYLQGKYDNAEFVYIAHDAEAWQVGRQEFFGIESGGGTRISAAYELAEECLTEYPFSEWNRFVFAAGDSENAPADTQDRVIPLMDSIDANLHAYLETRPRDASTRGRHAALLEDHFAEREDVVVSYVHDEGDVTTAIKEILRPESEQ